MRPTGLVYAFVALAGLQGVAHLTPAATEFRVIEVPGSSETIASAINAQGDVVGRYTGNDKRVHGFLLSGSRYTSIDVPHAEFTMVRGINDAGDLVGRATIKEQWVAFVMKRETFAALRCCLSRCVADTGLPDQLERGCGRFLATRGGWLSRLLCGRQMDLARASECNYLLCDRHQRRG